MSWKYRAETGRKPRPIAVDGAMADDGTLSDTTFRRVKNDLYLVSAQSKA